MVICIGGMKITLMHTISSGSSGFSRLQNSSRCELLSSACLFFLSKISGLMNVSGFKFRFKNENPVNSLIYMISSFSSY